MFTNSRSKLKRTGKLNIKGCQIFETVRKHKGGGGLAMGVGNSLNLDPVLVSQGDCDEVEILVVQIKVGNVPIRVITGYSPQEMLPNSQDFYSRLDEEIESSIIAGCGIIIEMDFNAKGII